jgi:hypothetical protein
MATLTMGVDLAAQPANTAVCLLRWGDGLPRVVMLARGRDSESTPLDDKWISTRAAGLRKDFGEITKVGIDDPFGWPVPFLDAMAAYRGGPNWPWPIDHPTGEIRLRETDRVVRRRSGRRPLSVTSDRIAIPAMRCAGLLTAIARQIGAEQVRRDGSGLCCEVYPDPALRGWVAGTSAALARASYKGKDNSTRRMELLGALLEQLPLDDPDGRLEQIAGEDDYLDALTSALVARAAERGRTYRPESSLEVERAEVEGWIHLPQDPLGSLA